MTIDKWIKIVLIYNGYYSTIKIMKFFMALTIQIFVGKVMSPLFNMLSRFVTA